MKISNNLPFIFMNHVYKVYTQYQHQVFALQDVSLEVSSGEQIAVIGKSGAGKSSLLHLIGTLDQPTKGEVFIKGTNVSKLSDHEVSKFRNLTMGFVFQMNNLLPELTALENVVLPGLIAGAQSYDLKSRGEIMLKAVGLEQRSKHRPGELSGGEQQRVAIARALLLSPPILLADEPTGNLDRKTSYLIQDLLLQLCDELKITMILVTHDLELAKRLHKRIVMEDGKILSIEN